MLDPEVLLMHNFSSDVSHDGIDASKIHQALIGLCG